MKRGQVTVFAIVAVVVIGVALLVTYVSQRSIPRTEVPGQLALPSHVARVHSVLDSCVSQSSGDALVVVFTRGGYVDIPRPYDTGFFELSYLYDRGQSYFPSMDRFEAELGKSIAGLVSECFAGASFDGLEIVKQDPRAVATVRDSGVSFRVDFPVSVVRSGSSFDLRQVYETSVDVDVKRLYDAAGLVVSKALEDPSSIPIGDLLDSGLDIEVTPVEGDKVLLYSIKDEEVVVNDLPLVFMFAAGF